MHNNVGSSPFGPKKRHNFNRGWSHTLVERDDNVVNGSLQRGETLFLPQNFMDHTVPKAEAAGRNGEIGAVRGEQAVISTAATDCTEFSLPIDNFENDAGVICQPANDGCVEFNPVSHPVSAKHPKEVFDFLQRGRYIGCRRIGVVSAALDGLEETLHLVKVRHQHRTEDILDGVIAHAKLVQHCPYFLSWVFVEFVDDNADFGKVVGLHAAQDKEVLEDFSRAHFDDDFLFGEIELLQRRANGGDKLGLGSDAFDAEDVHIPLVVLPASSTGDVLISPALRDGKPLDGKREGFSLPQHEAGETWRHLRAEAQLVAVPGGEAVHLLGYLVAPLTDVQGLVLHDGGIVFFEAEGFRCGPKCIEQVISHSHLVGWEVACSLDGVDGNAGGGRLFV